MPEVQPTTVDAAASSANKKSQFWLFAIVGLVLLSAAVAGVVWAVRPSAANNEAVSDQTPNINSTLHLESFVINLADPEQKAYLRVGIDLGLGREWKGKSGEGGPPVALVRDTILIVLSAYKPDELLTPAGKSKLKNEIVQSLQQRIPDLGVQEAYFTDFLVQR